MSDALSKFMNIWEIEPHFRCPVVGAMLSVEKHKTILKKCGYDVKKMKPYEYHQQIMAKLVDENNVSVKVNNFIKSRARKQMLNIAGKSEAEIRKQWDRQKQTGDVGPMMFAIVSYGDVGIELLHDVYGEVHMLAHANMTQIFDVRNRLTKTEDLLSREKQKNCQKAEEIKKIIKIRKTASKGLAALEAENLQLKNQLKVLDADLVQKDQFSKTMYYLEEKNSELEHLIHHQKEQLRIKEREKRRLQIELFSAKNEKEMIRDEMQALIGSLDTLSNPDFPVNGSCPARSCTKTECAQFRLCAKRIFMIGGITKMKAFYRDIVEKAGGKFDYHDGYLKNATTSLEARVKRSDLVLCPVNCNSHNACLKVKQLCNRHNKQLKILSSSSLSAVTSALFTNAEGEAQTVLN